MESRDRILAAAARVYAETGFRGATTRRIAEEAGVNEITIFRQFGSKAALIDEVVRATGPQTGARAQLPMEPLDPERELVAWCETHLAGLRGSRSFIRKTMGDFDERPDAVRCSAAGAESAGHELRAYLVRLHLHGWIVDWEKAPAAGDGFGIDPYAASAMLMGALFADVMGRDMIPEMYPQPEERAPAMYVRLFLRAIGLRSPQQQQQPKQVTRTRRSARTTKSPQVTTPTAPTIPSRTGTSR